MMATQPNFHWEFKRTKTNTITDRITGAEIQLPRGFAPFSRDRVLLKNKFPFGINIPVNRRPVPTGPTFKEHGRIGPAIKVPGVKGNINFGKTIGQFGTRDFTLAFGMKVASTHKDNDLDIIGNRTTTSHGNWFTVRLIEKNKIVFEVDQDNKAKHFAQAKTPPISMMSKKTWFHIAVVRRKHILKIYIDGTLMAEGKSKTGVANIKNNIDMKLGHSAKQTPTAQYEDLRIYHSALSAAEVKSLVTPVNRILRDGEVELIAADNAAIIINENIHNLTEFSANFKQLRVGKNTGVTLYENARFNGTAQKCYADLSNMSGTRLGQFPKSIRVWSAVGEPFTGSWVIKAPNGEFLSYEKSDFSTARDRSRHELFKFHFNLEHEKLQLIPGSSQESATLKIASNIDVSHLFIDYIDHLNDEFAITNHSNTQWLMVGENKQFIWTPQKDEHAIFARIAKMAPTEGHVGELVPGEVALYRNVDYQGEAWILSDSNKDVSGNHKDFHKFLRLNDQVSSIRFGPKTGATLFKHVNFNVADDKREEEIEDILENIPNLGESQIGNDALSSIQIFSTLSADEILTSHTSKLSQDYRMVDDKLEEFSAYRTTLRFVPDTGNVEISATDATTIEVEGVNYEIDEQRSVILKPNKIGSIMITSEAEGIDTPGIKIRTDEMAFNERVVIFPNQEVHQQISELEEGALWNAKDANGKPIVDQKAHSKEEVASVQSTIQRMMGTVAYVDEDVSGASKSPSLKSRAVVRAGAKNNALVKSNTGTANKPVRPLKRAVSGATIDKPWELKFKSSTVASVASQGAVIRSAKTGGIASQSFSAKAVSGGSARTNGLSEKVEEVQMSQKDFVARLKKAMPIQQANLLAGNLIGRGGFIGKRGLFGSNPFGGITDFFEDATSVAIGVFDDVVNVIVDIGSEVITFVVDTVEKVIEFVEAVVTKVVESIKKFIEFLQFLFGWEDILQTQRVLVKSIDAGFNSAGELVASTKNQVSSFVDTLQEGLNNGIDSMTRVLGVDPSKQTEDDKFELPEAAEWFLNKILGGSKNSSSAKSDRKDTSTLSSLEQVLEHILDALKDVVGIGAEVIDGLVDTVKTFIKNPTRPELVLVEILDAFRDVGLKILDFGENIALSILEAVITAIRALRDLLNAEIRIPLISELFELVGAGKLTILNLVSVLVAIPATVLSKLLFGHGPFDKEESIEFPKQPKQLEPTAKVALLQTQDGEQEIGQTFLQASSQKIDLDATRRKVLGFGIISIVSDLVNGVLSAYLDLVPEQYDDEGGFSGRLEMISLMLSLISWLGSFPSSKLEPGGYPYDLFAPHNLVNKSEDEQAYWERVLWGWRTMMLSVDIVYTSLAFFSKGGGAPKQRLKRANDVSLGIVTLFSLIDIALTIRFLVAIPKDDNKALQIVNETVARIPNVFAPLRNIRADLVTQMFAVLGLFAINMSATITNTGINIKLLVDDVEGLKEV